MRNVAELKGHRWEVAMARVELGFGEFGTPAVQVFPGKFDGVEDGPRYGGNVSQGPAKPWLGLSLGQHILILGQTKGARCVPLSG